MTSDAFACFTKPIKGNSNHLIIFSVYRTLGPVIVTRTSPLFFAIFFPVNLQVASISIYNNSAVIRAAEQFFTYRNCRREQKIKLLYARRLLAIFQFLRFFRLYLFLCFFFCLLLLCWGDVDRAAILVALWSGYYWPRLWLGIGIPIWIWICLWLWLWISSWLPARAICRHFAYSIFLVIFSSVFVFIR